MMSTVGGSSGIQQNGNTASQSPTGNPVDAMANENTFLKLLVAQLKNQDPESPQDGTQFVAQLAQFSSLEQQLQMRQDLDSIQQDFQTIAGSSTGTNTGAAQG